MRIPGTCCLFSFISVLFLVHICAAASGYPARDKREHEPRASAPLAEMMFYEAAEQAAEDSYARIIPDKADTVEQAAGKDSRQQTTDAAAGKSHGPAMDRISPLPGRP